jgi:2,3,4,5-tetrahydropyridine-2-carboxylate N-succinyltransferase
LREQIESLFDSGAKDFNAEAQALFNEFISKLESGEIRSAEPDANEPSGWRTNPWVKKGILLGFRFGQIIEMASQGDQKFFDKSTYPVQDMSLENSVRIVPGGSSIRRGSYVAPGVVCMPPMYINVGAYVGSGTMVDSHALVGSCAQIGERVHLSAAVQIGGVLEPIGANPVIIEDDVMIGGNCGVYEGTIVKKNSVLGTGVILNRSTPVYNLVTGEIHRADDNNPLIIPEGSVVIAGSRAVTHGKGKEWGLSFYTPVIVKIRDEKTDAKVQLEDFLR